MNITELKLRLKKTRIYFEFNRMRAFYVNYVIKKKTKLSGVNIEKLRQAKKSKSVIIIGSGKSLIKYLAEKKNELYYSDTIGMNSSTLLDFETTFHLFEFPGTLDALIDLPLAKTKSKTIFIVKDLQYRLKYLKSIGVLNDIRKLNDNFFYSDQVYIPHSSTEHVKCSLNYYRGRDKLISAKGTLFMAIYLAYILGYENIKLVGIDLYDSEYFFEDKDFVSENIKSPELVPTRYAKGRLVHNTIRNSEDSLSIVEIIGILNETILRPNEVTLTIENEKSPLFEVLKPIVY
jgi:hypothetical protein